MDCIVCRKHLPDVFDADGDNQPQGGTEFHAYGHYGSTVTGLMDGTAHCVNVCDACLTEALSNGRAFRCDVNRSRIPLDEGKGTADVPDVR